MRCPDCGKFVSNGDPELEEDDCDVNDDYVQATVTVTIPCADCGTGLKQHAFELEDAIQHECDEEVYKEHINILAREDLESIVQWEDKSEYELTDSDNWEAIDRYENHTATGKLITNPRYMKHYYGVKGTVGVACLKCGETIDVAMEAEEMASAFEEC